MEIRAAGITQTFVGADGREVLALQPTDLAVQTGEFVCLVGPSGCGKTTLLNVAAGLIQPSGGSVTLGGTPPRLGHPDVGYLLARDSLMPWRTALQNVMLPLEYRGTSRTEAAERAAAHLREVGLGDFAHHYPSQLSHGMRQRTALARTLVTEPTTLLMDEPFSALDAETRMQLQQKFLQLWERRRATVIFVTHDLAEAIALGDRIMVFSSRPGRIKEEFQVSLPRPRSVMDLQGSASYHDLYQQVWKIFREEVHI
jgi:NitT/TauT family transport system ATP-binding protein